MRFKENITGENHLKPTPAIYLCNEAICRNNNIKNASYSQKLFSFSCFKRVSDMYLFKHIFKHYNTTRIFDVRTFEYKNRIASEGFEVVSVQFIVVMRIFNAR